MQNENSVIQDTLFHPDSFLTVQFNVYKYANINQPKQPVQFCFILLFLSI